MPSPPHMPIAWANGFMGTLRPDANNVANWSVPSRVLRTTPYVPPPPVENADPPVLLWGKAQNFGNLDSDGGFEVEKSRNLTEVSRTSAPTRRVTNPADPNQWVDVDDIDSFQFLSKDQQRWWLQFKKDQAKFDT